MGKDGETWHLVEAKREDGSPTIFRIREIEARLEQTRIFVAELPYPVSELSRLPDAPSYRRFATFEEQWLDPACNALDWTPVAVKIEDGSFFVYLYGAGDPLQLVERLSPFDGALGFFDEADPTWDEYAALKELLDEAKAHPPRPQDDDEEIPIVQAEEDDFGISEHTVTTTPVRTKTKTMRAVTPAEAKRTKKKPAAKAKPKPKAKPAAKAKPKAKAKKPNAKTAKKKKR